MALMTSDIDGVILSALAQVFAYELQQRVAGDSLALKTLKQADLQDDPTLTAPYLVFSDDPDEGQRPIREGGEMDRMYGGVEIGGPVRFLHYFICKFGTPLATTREQCRSDVATLQARIEDTLEQYFDLSGVLAPGLLQSSDTTIRIEGANPLLIDKMTKRIYGGEQTFYGEGTISWHYPISRYRSHRVFTGS